MQLVEITPNSKCSKRSKNVVSFKIGSNEVFVDSVEVSTMYSYIFTEGISAPCKSTNQHYYSYIEGKLNTGIIGHVEVCL